jgi:hypothetical protein
MKELIELYSSETGDEKPEYQIAQHEWHQRYVAWLEKRLFELLNNPTNQ